MASYLPTDPLVQAETYIERTERYEDVTMQRFAEFLGVSSNAVSRRLDNHQWETLRNRWIENRLKQAMDAAYVEAKNQSGFTVAAIARHAGMPSKTVSDHLSVDEWRARRETLPQKNSVPLDLLRQAIDRAYAEAKTREDFTMAKIAALADIPREAALKYAEQDWRTRRETLPTTKEKVLATLQKLVDADTPVSELTRQHVIKLADVNGEGAWKWFNQPYHAACRHLALRSRKQGIDPPSGINVRVIPGGWVDINDNTWDLRPAGRHVLRRERLREDIADIGWPLLQEELRSPEIALATLDRHYQGFLKISSILRDEVPDVRKARLEAVQRSWMKFNESQSIRQLARQCLARIFEALMHLAELDDTIDCEEMLCISAWLQTEVTVGRLAPGEDFLSECELNAVIQGCLTDIVAGIAYTDANPDLLTVSVHARSRENATAVVRWSAALMILVMVFTGLRRESILGLKTNDWAEVRTGLCVLAWRHNKKVEENVAAIPSMLAQELQRFVQHTVQIRTALETEAVFLGNNPQGNWRVMTVDQFHERLHEFAKHYHLERDGMHLTLNSTVLRRTYATRALYEGRNLAALRSQLGHIHFESTLRYVKFDQYEHPAEVGTPLDEYGRKALVLWRAPLILNELDPDERISLLGVKVKREQDVGLCSCNHCVKAVEGSPPPCSLCEHLVTGPEFLGAWEAEHSRRKQELERLATESGSEMLLAQMKYQFERFEANFVFIRKRFEHEH